MTRSFSSQVEIIHKHGSWLRAAKVAMLALFFLLLAYLGSQGKRHPGRQAKLEEIVFCRDHLQEALDAQRSAASGPTPKRSVTNTHSSSRAVIEWAAKLNT